MTFTTRLIITVGAIRARLGADVITAEDIENALNSSSLLPAIGKIVGSTVTYRGGRDTTVYLCIEHKKPRLANELATAIADVLNTVYGYRQRIQTWPPYEAGKNVVVGLPSDLVDELEAAQKALANAEPSP